MSKKYQKFCQGKRDLWMVNKEVAMPEQNHINELLKRWDISE